MTGDEYFLFLMNILNSTNDIVLIEKIIKHNNEYYPINQKDIPKLALIYQSIQRLKEIRKVLLNFLSLNTSESINIIKNNLIFIQTNLGFDLITPIQITNDYAKFESIDEFIAKLSFSIHKFESSTANDLRQYDYLSESSELSNKVLLVNRRQVNKVSKEDFFGDVEIDGSKSRSASIRAISNNFTVGVISSLAYKEYIALESNRIATKNIQTILEKYIFNSVPRQIFIQRHFANFQYKKYSKGDVLFNEEEKIVKIFLITNGTVQLNVSKSLSNLIMLFKYMLEKLNCKENLPIESNKILFFKNKEEKVFDNVLKDLISNGSNRKMVEVISRLREVSIMSVQQFSILGLIESYLELDCFLSKGIVTSEKLEVFEIHKDSFKSVIDEGNSSIPFKINGINNTFAFLNRIDEIRRNYIKREADKTQLINNDCNPYYNNSKPFIKQQHDLFNFSLEYNKESLSKILSKTSNQLTNKEKPNSLANNIRSNKIKSTLIKTKSISKDKQIKLTSLKKPKIDLEKILKRKLKLKEENINSFFVTTTKAFPYKITEFNKNIEVIGNKPILNNTMKSFFSNISHTPRNPLDVYNNLSTRSYIIFNNNPIKLDKLPIKSKKVLESPGEILYNNVTKRRMHTTHENSETVSNYYKKYSIISNDVKSFDERKNSLMSKFLLSDKYMNT